ncbi:MAG: hypothetical protein KatS3mg123_2293 [Burkholderiales bacterium]|nr:MAG: hypothetical protein KatS3mg123_2293 [Burkholderiales bacterium]
MRWLILVSLPLLLMASCATQTQMALDAEVRRLCAIDGGIRVYEQVKLPADGFDRWGMPKMYQERVENKAAYRHDDKRTVMESVMKTRVDSARLKMSEWRNIFSRVRRHTTGEGIRRCGTRTFK